MTMQKQDRLEFDGEWYDLETYPLEAYWKNESDRPDLEANCSALWRGYLATWRVRDGRLWLESVRGGVGFVETEGGNAALTFGITDLTGKVFPGSTLPMQADWFSGELIAGTGEVIDHPMPYRIVCERYVVFSVSQGRIMSTDIRGPEWYRERHGIAERRGLPDYWH